MVLCYLSNHNSIMKLLSSVFSLVTWVIVGLIASDFVSVRWATVIGFVAFVVVAGLTYPQENKKVN